MGEWANLSKQENNLFKQPWNQSAHDPAHEPGYELRFYYFKQSVLIAFEPEIKSLYHSQIGTLYIIAKI